MKCSYCGEEMLSIDNFCNNCGAPNPMAANKSSHPQIPGPQAKNSYGPYNGQYGRSSNGYGQYNGQYGQNPNGYGQYNGQYSQYNGGGYIDPETASRVASGELISPAYVGFSDAVKLFFKNFTNFSGRSTRSEYWYMILFNMIVKLVLSSVTAGILSALGISSTGNILDSIYSLIFFIPLAALAVRRLHDIGQSGWWSLIFLTGVGIFVLLYWFCQPSGPPNQWGPDASDLYGGQGYGDGGPGNYNNYNRY